MPDSQRWWARDDLHYRDGRLLFAGRDIADLAAGTSGPLYLYSLDRVDANLDRVLAALGQTAYDAGVYYAMKANRFAPLLTRKRQSVEQGKRVSERGGSGGGRFV